MGLLWGSDEEKHTENSGGVTNKVVIGNKVGIINVEMLVLLGIICGVKVFEVICYIYVAIIKDPNKHKRLWNRT